MKLTKAQKIRLGTFVVSTSVTLGAVLITLAGLKAWERRDYYTVRFDESVGGLEPSAQVKYQGVRIGRVDKIRIAPDDSRLIEVTLSLEPGTPLHHGATAVLDMSGITGLKTINVTPGDPRAPLIEPGSQLPAGQSFVDRITGKAEEIGVKVEMVANNLVRWTGDENRVRVERLIDSMTRLATSVDAMVVSTKDPLVGALTAVSKAGATVDKMSVEGTQTLAASRETILEVKRILKRVDDKDVGKMVASAQSAVTRLDQRLSDVELGGRINELGEALREVTRLLRELDLAVRASREDFVVSLQHMRQASQDLQEFSRVIAQDPSVLLRGTEVGE